MTPCSLCTTPTPPLELLTVWLSGERRLDLCPDCIRDAVAGMVADIEQAKMHKVTPDTYA